MPNPENTTKISWMESCDLVINQWFCELCGSVFYFADDVKKNRMAED